MYNGRRAWRCGREGGSGDVVERGGWRCGREGGLEMW